MDGLAQWAGHDKAADGTGTEGRVELCRMDTKSRSNGFVELYDTHDRKLDEGCPWETLFPCPESLSMFSLAPALSALVYCLPSSLSARLPMRSPIAHAQES